MGVGEVGCVWGVGCGGGRGSGGWEDKGSFPFKKIASLLASN